jgi:predicted transcriptional regulator
MAALLSIWPDFLDRIFCGYKTAEVRKGTLRLLPGEKVWLYCTRPRARLEGFAIVEEVVSSTSVEIWSSLRERLGLSKHEYERYVEGRPQITVILFAEVVQFGRALKLEEIRESDPAFHPPQFYQRLAFDSAANSLFLAHAASNKTLKRTRVNAGRVA